MSGYSSAQCQHEGRCSGSADNYCYVHNIWSKEGHNYALGGANVWQSSSTNPPAYAFSTRCIAKADSTCPPSPCNNADCGDLAMCIELSDTKAICMTKYNIGDKTELPIASVVTAVAAGSACSSSATKYCCWQGITASTCDSLNGGYSGCTRTVCDWRAGNENCSKLTYLGKTWRLPTSEEWLSIKQQISSISIGQGIDGLMLCDYYSGYSSAVCYV